MAFVSVYNTTIQKFFVLFFPVLLNIYSIIVSSEILKGYSTFLEMGSIYHSS